MLAADATGLVFSRTFTVPSADPGGRVGNCTVTDGELFSLSPYTFTITVPETDAAPTVNSHTLGDGETIAVTVTPGTNPVTLDPGGAIDGVNVTLPVGGVWSSAAAVLPSTKTASGALPAAARGNAAVEKSQ